MYIESVSSFTLSDSVEVVFTAYNVTIPHISCHHITYMIPFVVTRAKMRVNRSFNTFFAQLKQLVTAIICVAFVFIYLTSSSSSSENQLTVDIDEEIFNYVPPKYCTKNTT